MANNHLCAADVSIENHNLLQDGNISDCLVIVLDQLFLVSFLYFVF